jgi:hypothetical protein
MKALGVILCLLHPMLLPYIGCKSNLRQVYLTLYC